MTLRLGKLPATADHRDLRLARFVDTAAVLPNVPASFGHERLVGAWGMLGNDRVGDCTCAGACHEHMLWTAETGSAAPFDDRGALDLYAAVTGYTPSSPETDRGAVVRDVLGYRRAVGVRDASGRQHRIDGYVAIDVGSWDELRAAAFVFGAVGVGFAFPTYAMDQFNAGRSWSYRRGVDDHPAEGHYVPWVAMRGGQLVVVTWGRLQRMTRTFFRRYADEAWAVYSREAIAASGRTLDGFDQASLDAAIAAI